MPNDRITAILDSVPEGDWPRAALQWARQALDLANDNREAGEERDETIAALTARVADLERDLEQYRDREQMLQEVTRNAADTPTERAVKLIETLHNEAIVNRQAGRAPAAEMDAREARLVLGGAVNRTLMYHTFERAVSLADTPALDYKKEDRSSDQNSRLRLNLANGDLPTEIGGHEIRTPSYEGGS